MIPFKFPPHSHEITISLSNGMEITADIGLFVAAIIRSLPQDLVIKIMKNAELLRLNALPSLDGDGSKVSTTQNLWNLLRKKA